MGRSFQVFCISALIVVAYWPYLAAEEVDALFCDVAQAERIEQRQRSALPLFYNQSLVGGYFLTPSARMEREGIVALGGGVVPPYNIYGGVIQLFKRFEFSGNYRTFKGGIAHLLSEDSDRIVNAKLALFEPADGLAWMPILSIGGSAEVSALSHNTQYIVLTKTFLDANLELSLGWGHKQLDGLFGGAAWTPFRCTSLPLLSSLTLLAEYDPTDYKESFGVKASFRRVFSRWNVGAAFLGWDIFQVSAMMVRGKEVAALASMRYPLGTTRGLLPKTKNPPYYDAAPQYGEVREGVASIACALREQGLFLNKAELAFDAEKRRVLRLKIINDRYRLVEVVKERLIYVLSSTAPCAVDRIDVQIEADGMCAYSYSFRVEDLKRFAASQMHLCELDCLAPMQEPKGQAADACTLYHKNKTAVSWMVRPRSLTYFQGSGGKFKYSLGLLTALEGYILDEAFYRLQASYAIDSSKPSSPSSPFALTPRSLPEVATDALRYHEEASFSLEEAYVQKGWYVGKSLFGRLACGYFEPAYVGGGGELLFSPVSSPWAIGVEGAVVKKRRYSGLGTVSTVRRIKGGEVARENFLGKQAFFNLHYTYAPLKLDFLLKSGLFLARDVGGRLEMTRTFESGFQFSLWYTLSSKGGEFFHDRGFAFSIPLDIFLRKSSRTTIGYAIAATLRNNGAFSNAGRSLYSTLSEERR